VATGSTYFLNLSPLRNLRDACILLYFAFRSIAEAALVRLTVPFALVGDFWFIWALGHAVSVATAVGFIALAGLAAEFGVVTLVYLRNALQERLDAGRPFSSELILEAIGNGAVHRVRPKAMTVAVILAGLLPIMFGSGAGSEVMQRIAAPMVGGMITAPLLSLFAIPAAWRLSKNDGFALRSRPRPLFTPTSKTRQIVIFR
jgi:Cu(I)/Ag(I) efflux system membrane protein CusA/SilA